MASAVLGAAFVSTDAALGSLSSARLSALLEQPDLPHRPALERYQQNAAAMHSTYTVGRVVCAALAAVIMADMVEPTMPGIAGLLLAVVATVALFAPLTDFAVAVARARADSWGPRTATFLRPFELALWPLATLLARVTSLVTDKLAEPAPTAPEVASAEVEYLVDEVERSGVVGAEPAEMIRNVLEFEDLRARDAMIPRTRVEAIDLATPLALVRRLVAESGHSRYPVYEDQLDNVVGLLVAKDVFKVGDPDPADEHKSLAEIVRRDVIFVHEHQKLSSLLKEMRQKRQHLAVVVDEFGGTSGIVTLEDIIEEIVGDIRDEHDEAEAAPIQEIGDGRLLANGSLCLADLSAYLAIEVPAESRELTLADCFEEAIDAGAAAERHGIQLIAREVANGRVKLVEISRRLDTSLRPPAPESGTKQTAAEETPAAADAATGSD
ncbi:MAG: HlyC/CorC family transporter [Myxococcales bacterium]|nr:HlyC/CorC family transporter [Myxococcales bacterium]